MSRGENALIAWFTEHLRADPARVPIGIGDDMAAVRLDGSLVTVTADMLLDGVHFDTRQHSLEQVGRKCIACSLSDCAAMGCRPRGATISLALPATMTVEDVHRLYAGMSQIAAEFDCPIVGGDTTSWRGALAVDVAMLAEPMSPRGPIRRSTARPGDIICVSGPLGGSILGRHLTFTPRIELASRLVQEPDLHAMMDLSDGLALDLHRLCAASGCAAELDESALASAISNDARALAAQDGRPALEHALSDGEDFELVVTGGESLTRPEFGLIAVGHMVEAKDGEVGTLTAVSESGERRPIEPRGYEHFT